MRSLCKLADSFIYVVSRQGVTGALGTLNANLPELLSRVKKYSGDKPAAVGFGVSTREHFVSVAQLADGVVVGSMIVTTLQKRRRRWRIPMITLVALPNCRGGMADTPPALSDAFADTGGSGVCFMVMRSSPGARAGRARNRARQPPDSSLRLPQ